MKDYNYFEGNSHITLRFPEEDFFGDASVYNHSVGLCASQLMMIAYAIDRAEKAYKGCAGLRFLEDMGFTSIEVDNNTARDDEDYIFCRRTVVNGKKKTDLVAAFFIGTRDKQWYENFDAGTGEIHKGFFAAKSFVKERLAVYLEKEGLVPGKIKLLLTGHSRGAAVANLLAADYLSNGVFKANDLFAYTFAGPAPSKASDTGDEKYKSIFNIINTEDFVIRCMPREWGYKLYGTTFALPSNSLPGVTALVQNIHKEYAGDRMYEPFPGGTKHLDHLFEVFTSGVRDEKEFYNKYLRFDNKRITLFEFFRDSLCANIAELPGSDENKAGTKMLLNATLKRHKMDKIFSAVSDYFIFYEGLYGVTKGKISGKYFSHAHDMCAYAAFMAVCCAPRLVKLY